MVLALQEALLPPALPVLPTGADRGTLPGRWAGAGGWR